MILKVILVLPTLYKILVHITDLLQKKFGDNWYDILADTDKVIKELENAETTEQKAKSAEDIRNLLKRLR